MYLLAFNNMVIDYVTAVSTRDTESGNWSLWISVYSNGYTQHLTSASLDLTLETEAGERHERKLIRELSRGDGLTVTWDTWIDVGPDEVKPWWPNGYGTQTLYNLTANVSAIDMSENSTKTVRVGFRDVELVQEELGKTIN